MTLDPNFLYPRFDSAPISYYCLRTLAIVQKYQTNWFKWYNYKWANILKAELEILSPAQFVEGFPLTANSRALHCFAIKTPKNPDTYDEQNITLGLVYSTGKTQLDGQAANIYGDFRVSSFYLDSLEALFYKLQDQDLTTTEFSEGWPKLNPFYNTLGEVEKTTQTEPANVVLNRTQLNPDSKISSQLNSLGLQGYLELSLTVSADSIKRPF